MKVTTFQGIVENGQVHLTDNVTLPEKTTVYVIVPGVELPSQVHLRSPKLVRPEQANDFEKKVIEEF